MFFVSSSSYWVSSAFNTLLSITSYYSHTKKNTCKEARQSPYHGINSDSTQNQLVVKIKGINVTEKWSTDNYKRCANF